MILLYIYFFRVVFVLNAAKLNSIETTASKETLDNKKSHSACANYYNNLHHNFYEKSNNFCHMKKSNCDEQDFNTNLNFHLKEIIGKLGNKDTIQMEIDKTESNESEENLENQSAKSIQTNIESDESSSKSTDSQNTENDLLNRKVIKKYPYLFKETQDTINFRRDPKETTENDNELNENKRFLRGEMKSKPNGDFISKLQANWFGKYDLLESHHGYIQWLFPIRTQGLNYDSHPLQLHELEELKNDKAVKEKIIESFKMMLDFYGMKLNRNGKITRKPNYSERYENLLINRHNLLRITRILKCLSDFELVDFQISWLEFLQEEIFVEKLLKPLDISFTKFWIHTVKDDEKRNKMIEDLIKIIGDKL